MIEHGAGYRQTDLSAVSWDSSNSGKGYVTPNTCAEKTPVPGCVPLRKNKVKEFFSLFFLQTINYSIISYNFRSIALGKYDRAALTSFCIATFSYYMMRRISKGDSAIHKWLGYATGGVAGNLLGIYASHF